MIAFKRSRRKRVLTRVPVTKDEIRRFSKYMDKKLRRASDKMKKVRGENFVNPRNIILD